jgi:hypothetical protein
VGPLDVVGRGQHQHPGSCGVLHAMTSSGRAARYVQRSGWRGLAQLARSLRMRRPVRVSVRPEQIDGRRTVQVRTQFRSRLLRGGNRLSEGLHTQMRGSNPPGARGRTDIAIASSVGLDTAGGGRADPVGADGGELADAGGGQFAAVAAALGAADLTLIIG